MKALVIPVSGPLEEVDLPDEDSQLAKLQQLVAGNIEAVVVPGFIEGAEKATAYVNEDGKFLESCPPNMRATDFMVPGVGMFMGDYVAGTFVLCGFDPSTGEHADLPAPVIARARLIESEAGDVSAPTTTQEV
jgi:hypothetical protein